MMNKEMGVFYKVISIQNIVVVFEKNLIVGILYIGVGFRGGYIV